MTKKIDLTQLPNEPGCYIFKDSEDNKIYIGKAKNIKKRVTSYFTKKDHDPKTKSLVKNINSIDFIATKNEIEALILENNLIKKNTPKYNIDLKDSKSYAFIELTDEEYPRFLLHRTTKRDPNKNLFGPFTSAKKRDEILQLINRTFKLRTTKKPPKRCIRCSIGICSCTTGITRDEYLENVNEAKKVLKGKIEEVIKELDEKMKKASIYKEYERAISYREQIRSLEYLKEKQAVERNRKHNEDIINFLEKENRIYLIVFNIYKGTLINKQEFIFEKSEDFFEQFIKRFYEENEIPREIIISNEVDPKIEEYLSIKKGSKVEIIVPKIGVKKDLLELVKRNIEISFFGDLEKLNELKRRLNLSEIPYIIECFDISHLSGKDIVASMVQFRNGRPDKSNYRRFKIRTVNQNDDFSSIREVVRRRYTRLKEGFLEFPNLILIDGGKGQLSSALEILNEIEIKIPVISLAKEFEEIYIPGNSEPITLPEKNAARLLLQSIRDEAHRFAINYNRLLRKKKVRE